VEIYCAFQRIDEVVDFAIWDHQAASLFGDFHEKSRSISQRLQTLPAPSMAVGEIMRNCSLIKIKRNL
jgi:hypothetical protein